MEKTAPQELAVALVVEAQEITTVHDQQAVLEIRQALHRLKEATAEMVATATHLLVVAVAEQAVSVVTVMMAPVPTAAAVVQEPHPLLLALL